MSTYRAIHSKGCEGDDEGMGDQRISWSDSPSLLHAGGTRDKGEIKESRSFHCCVDFVYLLLLLYSESSSSSSSSSSLSPSLSPSSLEDSGLPAPAFEEGLDFLGIGGGV